jgi:PAS domain-containing protein
MTQQTGARLLLPLTRLNGSEAPPPPVARTLDLNAATAPGGIAAWVPAVRASTEACLLLDADGRICAASPGAARVVGDPSASIGARFCDLVATVDFTSGAAPDLQPERAMPPLRALATGGLARGLMRVRVADGGLVTYDVVAVPLEGQRGVLAFFVAV